MVLDPSGCDAEKDCPRLVGILQIDQQRQRQKSNDIKFIDGQFFFFFSFLRKYRWTELNLKNSRLKTAVLPKATSSNQTSKSKFEFYNDKLSYVVMFSFLRDESSFLSLPAEEGKKERMRKGSGLQQ